MLAGTAAHALAYVALVATFNWEAESIHAAQRVSVKIGEAPPGAVAVRATSAEGETPEAQQPLLWEDREVAWRHTSDGGGVTVGALAAAGATGGAPAVTHAA